MSHSERARDLVESWRSAGLGDLEALIDCFADELNAMEARTEAKVRREIADEVMTRVKEALFGEEV